MFNETFPQRRIIQLTFEAMNKIERGLAPKTFEKTYQDILRGSSDSNLEELAQMATHMQATLLGVPDPDKAYEEYLELFRRERQVCRCQSSAGDAATDPAAAH